MQLTARCSTGIALSLLMLLAGSIGARAVVAQTQPMLLSVELPDQPAAGATIFKEKGCARCHSLDGRGTVVVAAYLTPWPPSRGGKGERSPRRSG